MAGRYTKFKLLLRSFAGCVLATRMMVHDQQNHPSRSADTRIGVSANPLCAVMLLFRANRVIRDQPQTGGSGHRRRSAAHRIASPHDATMAHFAQQWHKIWYGQQ
uniref:Putative secreted peptide n=1 Tax=Anopheles braziliensis TaxID=58242 RepID=A0A2M3ZXC2_9DIPT